MVCPFCLHKKTHVYNSRAGAKLNVMWRRRRCAACGQQFTTYESADPGSILTIREGSNILPFLHTKLMMSLVAVCGHRDDLDQTVPYLCGTVEQKLYQLSAGKQEKTVTKADIVATTAETLRNFDPAAYVAYTARHQKQLDAPTIRRALRRKK